MGHHQKKPVCFAHEKNPQETLRRLRKASCLVSQAPEGAQFTEESHGIPCPLSRSLLDILAMRNSFFIWRTAFNFRYCESFWYCKSYDNMSLCADNWRFVWYFTRRLNVRILLLFRTFLWYNCFSCRHRWTGRFEAHLWDKSCWNDKQNKKGKQGNTSFASSSYRTSHRVSVLGGSQFYFREPLIPVLTQALKTHPGFWNPPPPKKHLQRTSKIFTMLV